jgi:hypothetical protein
MESNTASRDRIRLSQLPFVVRLAVGLSFMCTWVLFEELIVDRTRLWALLPGYLKGRFCVWDLAAIGVIFVPLVLWKRWNRPRAT